MTGNAQNNHWQLLTVARNISETKQTVLHNLGTLIDSCTLQVDQHYLQAHLTAKLSLLYIFCTFSSSELCSSLVMQLLPEFVSCYFCDESTQLV